MSDSTRLLFTQQASSILQQIEVFSQVVKQFPGVSGLEKDEILEVLQLPYKNLQFLRRKLQKINS